MCNIISKALCIWLFLAIVHIPEYHYGQNNQKKDSLTLLFMGDIMGHDSQISAAFNVKTSTYDYNGVFNKISPIISKVDFAIANLEVTLAGAPYKGYPQFSSPDALAVACKNNGIDVLVTANNHSCDRGSRGLLRTIHTLDSIGIHHTGTFRDANDRANNNLLIMENNNIKVGLLNYTYGTNGIPVPKPQIVNLIDTLVIKNDISKAKSAALDKLIVVLHWGKEYETSPAKSQMQLADFMFKKGVDIIIGSHPHVLQKMEYKPKENENKENLIAYSLGNLVSNQRTQKRDGGAMFEITITKTNNVATISDFGYYLTWVNKPMINGKSQFEIIACSIYESDGDPLLDEASKSQMEVFMSDSRLLLENENQSVKELKYSNHK